MHHFYKYLVFSCTGTERCRSFLSVLVILFLFGCVDVIIAEEAITDIKREAIFEKDALPAIGRQETILNVSSFGRYAITAESPQGSALRLIDRLSGPGDISGNIGVQKDSRLDVFLDRGAYKTQVFSHENGSGTVKLEAHNFIEQNTPKPPLLKELKIVSASLNDFEKCSYWLDIQKRQNVIIEAAGRNLADLRLWKDGNWLVEAVPSEEIIEPHTGRPVKACRLAVDLTPGLYLLSAYGGPSQPWAETSGEHPFFIRMGIPELAEVGRCTYTASPFGIDRWLVPRKANYYRLEIPSAETASISVQKFSSDNPFSGYGTSREITKKSLPPVAEITTSSSDSEYNQVIIRREAGKHYILQHFEDRDYYSFKGNGDYWISTVHSGHGEDVVDATAILTETPRNGEERLIDKNLIKVNRKSGWQRHFNLLAPLTLYLEIEDDGKYIVSGKDAKAQFRIEPFMIYRPRSYKSPRFQSSGYAWDLNAGFYVLTAKPVEDGKGILDLSIKAPNAGKVKPDAVSSSSRFPRIHLNSSSRYTLYINHQPGVKSGVVLRRLPIDLNQALAVTQKNDEILEIPVSVDEPGTIRAISEDGNFLDMMVDTHSWKKEHAVAAGKYLLKIRNSDHAVVNYTLTFSPKHLESKSPLPSIAEELLNTIPKFPILSPKNPNYFDADNQEKKTFLVNVETPALYRLESTGLLQTEGNLRTRTNPSFDREAANGVGRNFLIQQYLKEGDYQLTTMPMGDSRGHLGIRLNQTKLHDGGRLTDDVPARYSLKAGEGLVYRFEIKEKGVYLLKVIGLDRDFGIRLEDADGWPLLTPGINADIQQEFRPGEYRLVILPQPVDARVLSLLKPVAAEIQFEGHGPHCLSPLTRDNDIHHIWNEPQEGEARIPDQWVFTVHASTAATIRISDEMAGELYRIDDSSSVPVKVGPRKAWQGELKAGEYRLEAKSVRKNNHLDYTLNVTFEALTAGHQKNVNAPAEFPVSVGQEGLVELFSFGNADVRAQLYDQQGKLVVQNDDRQDDWNFHIAQYLAAGQYRLKIEPVGKSYAATIVSMNMPVDIQENPLALPADIIITDNSLHTYPLFLPKSEELLLVAAGCRDSVMIAVKEKSNNVWHNLGTSSGKNPRLAVTLSEDRQAEYQLQVQSVDRRDAKIHVQAIALSPESRSESDLTSKGLLLKAVDGITPPTGVVSVKLSKPGLFQLSEQVGSLVAASGRQQRLEPVEKGLVLANGEKLWLVADTEKDNSRIKADRLTLTNTEIQLTVPEGERSFIDLAENKKGPMLVLAESRTGQPGIALSNSSKQVLEAKTKMGVCANAAVAVSLRPEQISAMVWNAGGSASLQIDVSQYNYTEPDPESLSWGITDKFLEKNGANRFLLPAGEKRVQLALPPATAAVLVEGSSVLGVHWSGENSITRSMDTRADSMLLMYIGGKNTNISIALTPLLKGKALSTLDSGSIFKKHMPTSGSIALEVKLKDTEKKSGLVLNLYGKNAEAVITENNGTIKNGQTIRVMEDASLIISHDSGLLLAWLEGGANDPWQEIAEKNRVAIHPSEQIRLHGKSMTLTIVPAENALLHVKTDVPAIAYICAGGVPATMRIFPDGTDLPVFLPSGSGQDISYITFQSAGEGDLSGTADIHLTEITKIGEGPGPMVRLEPGGTRIFSFSMDQDGRVGLGVKASADIATCSLMDGSGKVLGNGVVQMHDLIKGSYLLTVGTPPNGFSVEVQPIVVGLEQPGTGPPAEVIREYMEKAGLKPGGKE